MQWYVEPLHAVGVSGCLGRK